MTLPVVGGMRWAQSAKGWLGFFAMLPDGRAWLFHEMTFVNTSPETAGVEILQRCAELGVTLDAIYAQPELFPKDHDHGETISETFRRIGLPMREGHNNRVAGLSRLRSWFNPRTYGDRVRPGLLISPSCRYFIRTIPTLVSDAKDPDDVESTVDEYPAIGATYWAMSRPSPGTIPEVELPEGAIGHDVNAIRAELAANG